MVRGLKPSALLVLVSAVIVAACFDVANARRAKDIFYQRGTAFRTLLTCPLVATENSTIVWRSVTKARKVAIQLGESTPLATAYANGSIELFHSSSLRVPEQQLWSYSCERVRRSAEDRRVLEKSHKYNVVALDPPPRTVDIAIDNLQLTSAVVHWRLDRSCTELRYARCDRLRVALYEGPRSADAVPHLFDIPTNVGATSGSRHLSNLKRHTSYVVAVQSYSDALDLGGEERTVEFRTPKHGLLLLYPKDVQVKVLNLTSMEVTWQHVHSPAIPLTGYIVKYSIEGALTTTTVTVAAVRNTVAVSHLEPGNVYAFSVHSYAGHLDSIPATATRRLPVFHAGATATNATMLRVNWRVLPGSLDYLKLIVAHGGDKTILYPALDSEFVIIGGRSPGVRYTVRLVGKKSGERVEAVKLDTTMPSLLLLTHEHIGVEVLPRQKRIRVTFALPRRYRDAGSLRYVQLRLGRQLDIGAEPPFARDWLTYTPAQRTASLHRGVEVGQIYTLHARARYEHAGTTDEYEFRVQIPFTVVPIPGTPVIVPASSAVNVTWKRLARNALVDGFNVSFRLVGEDNWEYVYDEIPPSANLTTVENLLDGAEYEFRVQVYANKQYSAPSVARATLFRMPLTPRPLRVHARSHGDGVMVNWTQPADSQAFARKSFNLDLSPALGPEKWTSLRLAPNVTHYFFDPTRYQNFAVNVLYRMRMRAEYYQRGTTKSVVGSEKTAEQTVVAAGTACCRVPLRQLHADILPVRQLVVDARSVRDPGAGGIAVRWYPPMRRGHDDHITGYKIYYKFTALGAPISGEEFSQATVFYPRREVLIRRPATISRGGVVMTVRVSAMNTDGDGDVSDAVFAAVPGEDDVTASWTTSDAAGITEPTTSASGALAGGEKPLTVPLLIGAGLAVVVVAMTVVCVVLFVRYSTTKRSAAHVRQQQQQQQQRHRRANGSAGVADGAGQMNRSKPSRNAPLDDFMIVDDAGGGHQRKSSSLHTTAVQYSVVQSDGGAVLAASSNHAAAAAWPSAVEPNGAAPKRSAATDALQSTPGPTQQQQQQHQQLQRGVASLTYACLDFKEGAGTSSPWPPPAAAAPAEAAAALYAANTTTAPAPISQPISDNTTKQPVDADEVVAVKRSESQPLSFGATRRQGHENMELADELHQRIDYRLPHLVAFPVASASDYTDDTSPEPTPLKHRPAVAAEGAGRPHDVIAQPPPETSCREAVATRSALLEGEDRVSAVQQRSSVPRDYGRAFTPRPASVASILDIPVERGEVSC